MDKTKPNSGSMKLLKPAEKNEDTKRVPSDDVSDIRGRISDTNSLANSTSKQFFYDYLAFSGVKNHKA